MGHLVDDALRRWTPRQGCCRVPGDNELVTSLIRVPRQQHTVSKVVLRKFRRDGVLTVYDRQSNVIACKGPNGAFFVENFESLRPVETEERWSEVETKMDRV